jgi:hypothetical protein
MFVDKDYENIKIIDFGSSGTKDIFPFPGTYSAQEMTQDIYFKLYEEYVVEKNIKTNDDFFPPFYDKNDVFQLGFLIWDLFHYPQDYPFINNQENQSYENWQQIFQNSENEMLKKINKNIPDVYKYIIQSCWKYNMFERITITEIIEILENKIF